MRDLITDAKAPFHTSREAPSIDRGGVLAHVVRLAELESDSSSCVGIRRLQRRPFLHAHLHSRLPCRPIRDLNVGVMRWSKW